MVTTRSAAKIAGFSTAGIGLGTAETEYPHREGRGDIPTRGSVRTHRKDGSHGKRSEPARQGTGKRGSGSDCWSDTGGAAGKQQNRHRGFHESGDARGASAYGGTRAGRGQAAQSERGYRRRGAADCRGYRAALQTRRPGGPQSDRGGEPSAAQAARGGIEWDDCGRFGGARGPAGAGGVSRRGRSRRSAKVALWN